MCLVLAGAMGVPSVAGADGERGERGERGESMSPTRAGLTTETFVEPVIFNPAWQLLAAPETLVELAFTPAGFMVSAVERYRLDERIYDLLRNDAGTIIASPRASLSGGDGLGIGARILFENVLEAEERLTAGGKVQLNGDFELGARYRQSFASLEGRMVELSFLHELDQDIPYFGLGPDSEQDSERVLSSRIIHVESRMDVFDIGDLDVFGEAALGFLREELGSGSDASTAGLDPAVDDLSTPTGFDDAVQYADLEVRVGRDSRDTLARSTRGGLVDVAIAGTTSLGGEQFRSISATLSATGYLELFPGHRVLVLSAGAASVWDLGGEGIPFHRLVRMGRKQYLRGFERGRFRDRLGWWASAEYTYPIYEYKTTGVALSPHLFVDVGQVAPNFGDLNTAPNVSYGFGLRLAHETRRILTFEVGWSSEGQEFNFVLGKTL